MRRFVLVGVWLSCVVGMVSAFAQPWGVEQLMAQLASVKHTQAAFAEKRYSFLLKRPLEISGTLSFTAPDTLIKHSRSPVEEIFTIRGEQLVLERQEGGKPVRHVMSVHSYPTLLPLVQGVRATLAGDLATLREFYRIALEGNAERWTLSLLPIPEPAVADYQQTLHELIKGITIQGHQTQLRSIEIIEHGGDRSVMAITPS